MNATRFTNGFSGKIICRSKRAILGLKMVCPHNFRSKDFFEILHNERGQEVHGNYINGFSEKKIIQGKWTILGIKMTRAHNFG